MKVPVLSVNPAICLGWILAVFTLLVGVTIAAEEVTESLQEAACFNGFRYTMDFEATNWNSAAARCRQFGNGELARITSQAEQDFITNNFIGVNLWIGLRKQNNTLQWASGETNVPYDNFQGDIQQSLDNQCFMIHRFTPRRWLSSSCHGAWHFICKEETDRPYEWFSCKEMEWRLYEERALWMNAERSCQSNGGHLAKVEEFQSLTSCAHRALKTCFRNGPQLYSLAFVGLSNLINLGTYRWSSDNQAANFSLPLRSFPQCAVATFSGGRNGGAVAVFDCSSQMPPYICQRNLTTARTLFTLTCQGRTYRYNTIAFSWQEAEQSCTATGGSLLQATNNTQLFCADQLLQRPELTIDRTVTEIGNWIDFSNTTVRTLGLCPQWIASFNSVLHVNCSRPSPYICSTGPAVPLSTTDTKTSDISNSFQVLYIAVCVVGGLALLLTMACGVFFCRNYKQRMRSLTHRHSDDVDERSTQLQADVSNRNSDARDMTSNPAYGIVLNTSCHTTLLTPLLPIQNAIEMTESIAYGLQPDSDLGLQSSHYPVEAVNSTAEDGDYSYIDPRF